MNRNGNSNARLGLFAGRVDVLGAVERDAHDRKTAVAVYGVMAAAALVVLIALVAFVGPVLSEITSELNGML